MVYIPTCLACVFSLLAARPILCSPLKRADACNGSPDLCDRSYGNVTFLGSHDSYAVSNNPLALSRNQEISVEEQLKLGSRLLQAQAHVEDDKLRLCHTSCTLFDGGLAADFLKTVKSFLDSNPTEVLTLLFTNPDSASLTDLWKPAFDESGISELAYVPKSTPVKRKDWPTLGEMIDSGKRVVVFMDSGANVETVDFIMPEFDHVWEPPFDSTDSSFPCSVDRSGGSLSTGEHLYLLNHFLDTEVAGILIPDRDAADETNSVDSITADAADCIPVSESGEKPNFVLLDWVDSGEGVDAVKKLNGL